MDKIILFDFDGTIADTFGNFLEMLTTLSKKYKFPNLTPSEIEGFRNYESREVIKKLKVPFYKLPFIASDMQKMQKEKIGEIEPFKDLPEVLQKLKSKGYILGILTSNSGENVKVFIKNNNLDIFDYLYTDAGIFGKVKLINKFLKKESIDKQNIIYVGDEIRDILACQKVGIKIVSVTWGFNSRLGLMKYNPNIVDSPVELLNMIEDKLE